MDCIWCPLKLINRQKMKSRAYTCEPVSARALASRGSGKGCFGFLWSWTKPMWQGLHWATRKEQGWGAGRRREQGKLKVCLVLVPIFSAGSLDRRIPQPLDLQSDKREIFEWLQTL